MERHSWQLIFLIAFLSIQVNINYAKFTFADENTTNVPSSEVAVFYYPWYGNQEIDGEWIHWDRDRNNVFYPPLDISSDYYPVLGAYSSMDPTVVSQHFEWLRGAKVGVIITSWWGQGTREDQAVSLLLDIANQYGIKVAFHIEPYSGRTAQKLVSDINYIYNQYGQHPAFYRTTDTSPWSKDNNAKGLFFLWASGFPDFDSDQVEPDYWQAALDAIHAATNGGLVIANDDRADWINEGHFDGLYNYATLNLDESDGFLWARNLPKGAWYVPSVLPGFSATRIGTNINEPRLGGETFDQQWEAALGTYIKPNMVTITSFNEWHEGTQIEPAAESADNGMGYTYKDYIPLQPEGYLDKTRQWVEQFQNRDWPINCPLKIQMTTSSDWTTFGLISGGGWLRPEIVSASPEATYAGVEGDYFLLLQPLARAQDGGEVEMAIKVDFVLSDSNGLLKFYIERGHIGSTQIIIMDSQERTLKSIEWNGINPDPRNTLTIDIPASRLNCLQPSKAFLPALQLLLYD